MYRDIDILFSSIDSKTLFMESHEYKTIDKAHGCLEIRTYSIVNDIKFLSTDDDWQKLQSIGRIQRICEIGTKTSEEIR